MDIVKRNNFTKAGSFPSPHLGIRKWLNKELIIRNYAFPVKNIFLGVVVVLTIVLLSAYFFFPARAVSTDPNVALQREIKNLTVHIGTFMALPEGEQPTLATVTDKEKLNGQEFFTRAQNGDKLLVYVKAKKAILYRPSTGKIIEVTNLASGTSSASSQS